MILIKTLDGLSCEVRSVHLQCSFDRYARSRSQEARPAITPFKAIFNGLVAHAAAVESVRIGVEKPLRAVSFDDVEDESDDLYLTDVKFVGEWLPKVSQRLRSVSISDFWVQSCWRRSELLSLISSYCHGLLELEVKNAWLSVDGLNPMPMLTSLTLEFVNDCFPSLQVLKLLGVGGLIDPRIHLLKLKTCHWTVSNAPVSLTIVAPKLVNLKLKCVKPRALVIEAPLLSDFHLTLEKANDFVMKEFCSLKTLWLESTNLCNLLCTFPFGKTITNLKVDSPRWAQSIEMTKFSLEELFKTFPNASSLTLGSGAWSELELCCCEEDLEVGSVMKGLKEVSAYLMLHDIERTLSIIFFLLKKCTSLSDVEFLVHRDVDSSVVSSLVSRCVAHCSRVRWRWGMWKEGMKDSWLSDGFQSVYPDCLQ
ncbi:hypothetical protein RJ639_042396, partial [Escallonia herrerae]